MRYPVLWEKHEPVRGQAIDWSWAANQLNELRQRGVEPIVGLVHHGSGPVYTNLADANFATYLASYAGKVAQEFPWIDYYTPVNEPLTTARFSGLYGFWYPHAQNDLMFVRALINQLKAVVFSMREIRKVNPAAKLIQTDDLCKVYSDRKLQYQADFENERRWLTFDLLCGRVDRSHALWDYFQWLKVPREDLAFFSDNPCPPDIAGFNYYVTSERYLDPNLPLYPKHLWGGNRRHRYVDTEAIRVRHDNPGGLKVLLAEAWERFKLPIAITEVFLSCNEDDQVRWLLEACLDANHARSNGIDIRAVTFWGLLGECGWNKLVTTLDGAEFENGAYRISDGQMGETAVARFIKSITSERMYDARYADLPGWWKREDRFLMQEQCIEK
jgi:dTDP-4-dehydrorhamnose reductase